jgi:hypothetical protein
MFLLDADVAAGAVYSGSDAWPLRMVSLPDDSVAAKIAERSVLMKVRNSSRCCAARRRWRGFVHGQVTDSVAAKLAERACS